MRALTRTSVVATIALLGAGCSGERIVNTGEPPAATPTSTSTAARPPLNNTHLVDAFDYVAHPTGRAAYYFTTPSGRWRCAILPRDRAGCQSASGWQSGLGIDGEPDTVTDAAGEATTPNAIVVPREGEPQFVALEQPEFWLNAGRANVLQFNRTLAAAGFRCNVQESSGVSCMSEFSGKGFTFSAEGFAPHYTDVPAGAP